MIFYKAVVRYSSTTKKNRRERNQFHKCDRLMQNDYSTMDVILFFCQKIKKEAIVTTSNF